MEFIKVQIKLTMDLYMTNKYLLITHTVYIIVPIILSALMIHEIGHVLALKLSDKILKSKKLINSDNTIKIYREAGKQSHLFTYSLTYEIMANFRLYNLIRVNAISGLFIQLIYTLCMLFLFHVPANIFTIISTTVIFILSIIGSKDGEHFIFPRLYQPKLESFYIEIPKNEIRKSVIKPIICTLLILIIHLIVT